MSRTRRSFPPEFKVEAARRVIDSGRSVAEVARELNLHENLLRKWVVVVLVADRPVEKRHPRVLGRRTASEVDELQGHEAQRTTRPRQAVIATTAQRMPPLQRDEQLAVERSSPLNPGAVCVDCGCARCEAVLSRGRDDRGLVRQQPGLGDVPHAGGTAGVVPNEPQGVGRAKHPEDVRHDDGAGRGDT